jgi:hypothetical protein
MFGKLLSSVTKIATIPLDVVNIGIDVVAGGDGSKASRSDSINPLENVAEVRDDVADALEELDE